MPSLRLPALTFLLAVMCLAPLASAELPIPDVKDILTCQLEVCHISAGGPVLTCVIRTDNGTATMLCTVCTKPDEEHPGLTPVDTSHVLRDNQVGVSFHNQGLTTWGPYSEIAVHNC